MPRMSRSDVLSQPRTSAVRSGSAAANTVSKRSTAFLAQVSAGTTSTLPTTSGLQSSARAMLGARRRFLSMVASRS